MSGQMSGKYEVIQSKSADYTVDPGDDAVVFTAATALTCTLYSPVGKYFRASPQGGRVMIINAAASINTVTVASASGGSIVGLSVLSPGQVAVYISDGQGNWYAESGAGGSSIGAAQTIRVNLTSANILAMFATPVAVIPAPGTGKLIIPDVIVTEWVPTATQYASGGATIFQYDSTANGAGVNSCNTTIAAAIINAATEDTTVLRGSGTIAAASSGFLNKGIFISNATGAFTTGTGVARITATFRILTP